MKRFLGSVTTWEVRSNKKLQLMTDEAFQLRFCSLLSSASGAGRPSPALLAAVERSGSCNFSQAEAGNVSYRRAIKILQDFFGRNRHGRI